ncbi:MAG: methionine gamma-lyase family protein [Gracilibacteraceae bacterium]|jgi:cystathionine beta-lyase family protein involved in aluminum resistance|nr:methionine gamma-lyase family protein [Gracilibacteraceae bacterium]
MEKNPNIDFTAASFASPPAKLAAAAAQGDEALRRQGPRLEEIAAHNHRKMLRAFQAARISSYHLHGSTGYGLDDAGRAAMDSVVAAVLGAESALVRHQFVSGTHAIAAALFGVLRPGDHALSVTGSPYDTLLPVIGTRGERGSLREWGVSFTAVPLTGQSQVDFPAVRAAARPETRLFLLQRSAGYAGRRSLSMAAIAGFIAWAKENFPEIYVFVDNCYGELVEKTEPGDAGADLMAGSLIKNLGGTLAPSGGYVAGRKKLVEMAADRFAAPGIGMEVGASLDARRLLLQGLFFSPLTVAEAVKSMIFTAAFWAALGFTARPAATEPRADIIQAVELGSAERLTAFCRGLQSGTPIDAHVRPEPAPMPGYADEILMAGGVFIQGATSEFSADGPLRPPYTAYMQGGVSIHYTREANLLAARRMAAEGLL